MCERYLFRGKKRCSGAAYSYAVNFWNRRAPEPEPKPLTLDELRERDGMPVWVVEANEREEEGRWALVHVFMSRAKSLDATYSFHRHRADWLAYDRPPKEV